MRNQAAAFLFFLSVPSLASPECVDQFLGENTINEIECKVILVKNVTVPDVTGWEKHSLRITFLRAPERISIEGNISFADPLSPGQFNWYSVSVAWDPSFKATNFTKKEIQNRNSDFYYKRNSYLSQSSQLIKDSENALSILKNTKGLCRGLTDEQKELLSCAKSYIIAVDEALEYKRKLFESRYDDHE